MESRKMKKQRDMFQMNSKLKPQGEKKKKKNPYEMRCYLPKEVKNNSHKDAH